MRKMKTMDKKMKTMDKKMIQELKIQATHGKVRRGTQY